MQNQIIQPLSPSNGKYQYRNFPDDCFLVSYIYACRSFRSQAETSLRSSSLIEPWESTLWCIEKAYTEDISDFLVQFAHDNRPAFYQTLYWALVSECKKSMTGYICEVPDCGVTIYLHAHHKSYSYIGLDHLYFDYLEVLCEGHHAENHGKGYYHDHERRQDEFIRRSDSQY